MRSNKRYHRNSKDYMRILWTAVYQQTGQPRKNGQILKIIQPSKIESVRNRKSK